MIAFLVRTFEAINQILEDIAEALEGWVGHDDAALSFSTNHTSSQVTRPSPLGGRSSEQDVHRTST